MPLFSGKEEVLGRKLKVLEAGIRLSPPVGTMLTSWSPRAFFCKRSLLGSGRSAFASFQGGAGRRGFVTLCGSILECRPCCLLRSPRVTWSPKGVKFIGSSIGSTWVASLELERGHLALCLYFEFLHQFWISRENHSIMCVRRYGPWGNGNNLII